ncbi:hypothetical protein BAUCODRAFT_121184 [Baudoinia panamericana UAMH 10762]|uniref:Uncharacterized protein n=1 Tax=Baudoinia panamericana (strain UAMH 10762) TaxID=717646 RepID=M2LUN5_BAUPA|nr:uncharacterized protein BAUCODRAFT_121184 [Baudoinia panamericana UAMH 10762]EMC98307.1 hypothetical protein BAUCODRAFT_121184 [Baudoinia panamericana UAMH 10762]
MYHMAIPGLAWYEEYNAFLQRGTKLWTGMAMEYWVCEVPTTEREYASLVGAVTSRFFDMSFGDAAAPTIVPEDSISYRGGDSILEEVNGIGMDDASDTVPNAGEEPVSTGGDDEDSSGSDCSGDGDAPDDESNLVVDSANANGSDGSSAVGNWVENGEAPGANPIVSTTPQYPVATTRAFCWVTCVRSSSTVVVFKRSS